MPFSNPSSSGGAQQVVYHRGAPANPQNTAMPAIALNEDTNAVSHRWNTGTGAWVAMASGVSPNASNFAFPAGAIIHTPNNIVANGGSRAGVLTTTAPSTANFTMGDGDYTEELQLAAPATTAATLHLRNDATLTYLLRTNNTDLLTPLSFPTNSSLNFRANAALRWVQVPQPAAPTVSVAKATAQHVANAGTAQECGSIRLRMNTQANRGLQIQSATGANLTWRSMSNWEGGGSAMNTGTATTSGWGNISDFNFSAISQFQNSIIWDETNNRKYLVFYTVQASFNNSPMMITEL